MEILENSALALSSALERKELSAVELMQATLDRIAATNGAVNAVVSLREADALLADARRADESPRNGWLHGIPMAIKDLANAKGLRNTMGSPIFADQVSAKDDAFVARLKAAGAIIIGKTNTPEFGLGSHTFNPVHGATGNPYDVTRSAGGSSGGAAAALATRMLCVADGSDMMGSLRNPAGWNNVYGMRPTWGLIPGEAVGDDFQQHMATSGPMARNPRDLAVLLGTMAGDAGRPAPEPATGLRIGWLGDWGGAFPMETGIMEISEAAVAQLAALGHHVEAVPAPFAADEIWESWITLRSFAIASGSGALYHNPQTRALLKDTAVWEIERGLGFAVTDVYQASARRVAWARVAEALFEQFDAVVLPSAQCWPFPVDWDYPKEIGGIGMDTYHRWMQVVVPASLLGLPVVNLPVGFGDAGLPAGLQLIGPWQSDVRLLDVAQGWHEACDWPGVRPMDL